MTVILPSSIVRQRPKTTEHYSLEPANTWGRWWVETPSVRALQPARLDGSTLTISVSSKDGKRTLAISGGVAGATYDVSVGAKHFRLRVTHDVNELALPGPIETMAKNTGDITSLGAMRRLRLSRDERRKG